MKVICIKPLSFSFWNFKLFRIYPADFINAKHHHYKVYGDFKRDPLDYLMMPSEILHRHFRKVEP